MNSKLLKDHISVVEELNEKSDKVISLIRDASEYDSTHEAELYYCFYLGRILSGE